MADIAMRLMCDREVTYYLVNDVNDRQLARLGSRFLTKLVIYQYDAAGRLIRNTGSEDCLCDQTGPIEGSSGT